MIKQRIVPFSGAILILQREKDRKSTKKTPPLDKQDNLWYPMREFVKRTNLKS